MEMKEPINRIAVVTAHPDDLMPCFGTILLSRGLFEWHVIDFTRGERGLGEAGYRDGSTAKTRMAEEDAVCWALGAEHHWLDEIYGEAYACREACEYLAALAKESNVAVADVDATLLRARLRAGGAFVG
jgi:LmbE family N-acetylglucosaminyl deacetylase